MEINQSKNKIDMLNGPLLKSIVMFALPLAASSILQQLFNAIDVAVVGQFATSQDQAAVGCNAAVINLVVNLFVGMSIGTNVAVANYLGQKNYEKAEKSVHTSVIISVIGGVALLVLGIFIARPILVLIDTPSDTLELAVTYLKIYFIGMPFIMVYNFGAAILRSVGDTKRPLYCLFATGVINALLNLVFVIVFKMGVAGVAWATLISNVINAVVVLYWLFKEEYPIKLVPSKLKITGSELSRILKIGVPSGVQGMVFSIANVFIQAAINGFGSAAVAGSAVTMNYEYMTYFAISAFSQAATTFISQNHGAGNIKRCKKVFTVCMTLSTVVTALISWFIVLNGHFFASLFTSDEAVMKYAVTRMVMNLTVNFIANSYEIGGAALRGLGYSLTPSLLTVFGTCALRLIWIYTIFQTHKTFSMLLMAYPVSWAVTGILVFAAYLIISKKVYAQGA